MTKRLALALRRYLREGRPGIPSGKLFVIHRAPIGQPLKPIGIRGIVVRYAARAGMAELIRGTHIIRHSVASPRAHPVSCRAPAVGELVEMVPHLAFYAGWRNAMPPTNNTTDIFHHGEVVELWG